MKTLLSKNLQSVLWSVKIDDLDIKKDKVYIIHQILAFGNLKQLQWLFNNYSKQEIRKIFLEQPMRIYRPSAFNFIKEIFLEIKKYLNEQKYVSAPLPIIR